MGSRPPVGGFQAARRAHTDGRPAPNPSASGSGSRNDGRPAPANCPCRLPAYLPCPQRDAPTCRAGCGRRSKNFSTVCQTASLDEGAPEHQTASLDEGAPDASTPAALLRLADGGVEWSTASVWCSDRLSVEWDAPCLPAAPMDEGAPPAAAGQMDEGCTRPPGCIIAVDEGAPGGVEPGRAPG